MLRRWGRSGKMEIMTKPAFPTFELDPDIEAAVADVDRSLLAWFATLSPTERLQYVTRQMRTICEAREAARKR
jgi:hypothetical protein